MNVGTKNLLERMAEIACLDEHLVTDDGAVDYVRFIRLLTIKLFTICVIIFQITFNTTYHIHRF